MIGWTPTPASHARSGCFLCATSLSPSGTLEDYCRERWGMSRVHAHRQIEAAKVASNLLPTGNIPTTERQARPLVGLPVSVQGEAWGCPVCDNVAA